MPGIHTDALDAALAVLDLATTIHICSAEPARGPLSNTTAVTLGNKNLGAGNVFGAPAAGTPNGRKASSTAIAAGDPGAITAGGTAGFWAAVDGTRTLAAGTLSAGQVVVNGATFTLASFDVTLPANA